MIDEELSVGRWQTPHSFSLPNRLMPRFGVRRRIFDDESNHTIDLGERFLHRRFSGYLDHPLTADLFRPFLKRFVLITIGATAEFLAVASRSSLGLIASSPARAPDLLASLPGVMASQALAFCSPAESWPLSCATVVCLAGSTPHFALAAPMPP